MATLLDLEEQEQLDQLKSFWKRYGSLVTWVLVALLAAYAAWTGWNVWQRDQAAKAGAMFDELDRAAQAGDVQRTGSIFLDLKDRYPRTAFAEQGGLLAAKVQFDKGQPDAALGTLAWVASSATEQEYQSIARLRAAGVLLDQKKYDEALKQLDAVKPSEAAQDFGALVDDRRGDVLVAEGKREEAKAAFTRAWQAMDGKVDYRRLIEAKLTSLGATPGPAPVKPVEGAK